MSKSTVPSWLDESPLIEPSSAILIIFVHIYIAILVKSHTPQRASFLYFKAFATVGSDRVDKFRLGTVTKI